MMKILFSASANARLDEEATKQARFVKLASLIPNRQTEESQTSTSANPDIKTLEEFHKKLTDGTITNINETDYCGWSYLHYAAARNNVEAINMLLKFGADVNLTSKEKETPLYISVVFENLEAVNALLKGNANVNTYDALGSHLLFIAEIQKNEKLNEILNLNQRKQTVDIYRNELLERKREKEMLFKLQKEKEFCR